MACYQRFGADVCRDVAHKTSHTLAVDPRYKLYVFEALKVKNMTRKAKPRQDARGFLMGPHEAQQKTPRKGFNW